MRRPHGKEAHVISWRRLRNLSCNDASSASGLWRLSFRGKTIVFGIYKRNGRVYTEIVPNCKKAGLQAIIRGKVELTATIHTDGFRSYDGIVHMGYRKHYRVRHDRDEFARGSAHIDGMEGLWGMAKTRLAKFRGMRRSTFYLHPKECEFRLNHRAEDLYRLLLKITRSAIAI